MRRLNQVLDISDDSFSYFEPGEDKPTYVVDSHAALYLHGKQIGYFRLRDDHWELHVGDKLIECSPRGSLFGLPEFELASLTRLINKKEA